MNLRDSIWLQSDSCIGGKTTGPTNSAGMDDDEIKSIVEENVETVDFSTASELDNNDNNLDVSHDTGYFVERSGRYPNQNHMNNN